MIALRCEKCSTPITMSGSDRGGLVCPGCGATVTVYGAETRLGAAAADPSADAAGAVLDLVVPGYEIVRLVGRGGMGYVLEARQTSLDRRVAIKVLAPHLAHDAAFVARFEQEAAALARLSHPNIVAIYERGRSGDCLFFIMEYIEGDAAGRPLDLKMLLQRGPLSDAEAQKLMGQILGALRFAHDNGIIHRDIKPGNILIDRHGNAKVADFGIASVTGEPDRERFTMASVAMGTYDYMAPEQRRDASAVDERVDVYSAGAVLYEMLTGHVAVGAFQAPSVANAAVHPSWNAIVAAALHPVRDQRLASMEEFARRVQGLTFVDREAPDAPAPFTAAVALVCPECRAAVSADALFCESCSASQWLDCPGCGERTHAGTPFCGKCGGDIQQQRNFLRHADSGERSLSRALELGEDDPEGLRHALDAGLSFTRALRIRPGDATVRARRDTANARALRLARRAAVRAYEGKRLGSALEHYGVVLELDPQDADAVRNTKAIVELRDQAIARARAHRDAGNPKRSLEILDALRRGFPDDPAIESLRAECGARTATVHKAVAETLPALIRAKRWHEVGALVEELRSSGVRIHGVDALRAKAKGLLADADAIVSVAAEHAARGHVQAAARSLELALRRVADHPRGLALRDSLSTSRDEVKRSYASIRQALEAGRWFRAWGEIGRASPAVVERVTSSQAMIPLRRGTEMADNYLRVVTCTVAGCAGAILAALLVRLAGEGLEDMLPRVVFGEQVLGQRWFSDVTLATVHSLCTVAICASMCLWLGRPPRMSTTIVCTVVAVGALLVVQATRACAEDTGVWSGAVTRLTASFPAAAGALRVGLGIVGSLAEGVWITMAFGPMLSGLVASTPTTTRLAMLLPPIVAVACCPWVSPAAGDAAVVTAGVIPACLLCGLALLCGFIGRWRLVIVLFPLALLAGAADVGLTRLSPARDAWWSDAPAFALLSCAVVGFAQRRSRALIPAMLVVVAISFVGARWLRGLETRPEALQLAVAWCMFAGGMIRSLGRRDVIECRLHLWDRFVSRRFLPETDESPSLGRA